MVHSRRRLDAPPGSVQRRGQFLVKPSRCRRRGAGKRTDHQSVPGPQFVEHRMDAVPQSTGDPVADHGVTDRPGHHQPDSRTARIIEDVCHVKHQIGLRRAHPFTDRGTELRRPGHPVPSGKHRVRSRVDSRSERTAALTTTARHDRPAGTGTHPQPEPVHPRATAVVGLECPLALGHGNLSLFGVASAFHPPVRAVDAVAAVKLRASCVLAGAVSVSGSQPYRHVRATVRGY